MTVRDTLLAAIDARISACDVTVRDTILAAIAGVLEPFAREVEIEPVGDPIQLPALGITDAGHVVVERETDITRRIMTITIDGFVDGSGGRAPNAQRSALQAAVVSALMEDETLGGLVELIEDGALRMFTAMLSEQRRLGFAQDFEIQFTTSRVNPAVPA